MATIMETSRRSLLEVALHSGRRGWPTFQVGRILQVPAVRQRGTLTMRSSEFKATGGTAANRYGEADCGWSGSLSRKKGRKPSLKRYLDEQAGSPVTDLWDDISPLNSQAQERLGYPTQKPVALLERIIAASSNEGDLVLDPFLRLRHHGPRGAEAQAPVDRHRRHPSRHRADRAAHERGVSRHRL